ncbi:gamma-glutamyltranspeptidase periplasmic precursor [Trichoderma barbatum]
MSGDTSTRLRHIPWGQFISQKMATIMAQPSGANSSKLGPNGYDFIVAATQASINSDLKEFLAEDNQPVQYLCFVMDSKVNIDKQISIEDVKKESGVDPFTIPPGTPFDYERVQALYNIKFSVGIKMRMGLHPEILPKNLPDVVEFRDEANNVKFRLMCSEFVIVQVQPALWGEGERYVFNQRQKENGQHQTWYFETTVDLVRASLDENLDIPYFKEHPKEHSTVLQSIPEIVGLPKGSNASLVLKARLPLLSINAVAQSTDPSQLRLTDFERQINQNKSEPKVTTLDNVCAINGNRLPTKYSFDWNWVEPSELNSKSGVISINRNTIAKSGCIQVRAGVKATWDGRIEFRFEVSGGQTPTSNIPPSGATVAQFKYTSQDYDEDKWGLYKGHLVLDSAYTVTLEFTGNTGKLIRESQANIDIKALSKRIEFKMHHKVITDTYKLSVDQGGSLRLPKRATAEWFNGVTDVKLKDAPLNGISNFVYPGSKVFTFKEASFSNYQDLVSSLTSVSPSGGSNGRSPLGSALGLKIDYSSELMQNYVQGEIVPPTDKFEALQTYDLKGHTLLFSIDSNGIFTVIKEDSGKTSTGWEVTDLSSHTTKQYLRRRGGDEKIAPRIRTFGVGQSPLDATIGLAMVVDSGGSDRLFLSLNNSGSVTSWINYVNWSPVPFDESSMLGKPIRIADYIIVDDIVRYYDTYQSVIGRKSGGGSQLMYQPINIFGEEPPSPSRFQLPGGTIASAIAAVRHTNIMEDRLYGTTDLYAVGNSKLYRFPADEQQGLVTGKEALNHALFSGVKVLRGMTHAGVVTLWGKNPSNEVFYTSCLSDKVADPNSWSVPVPILNGVELMSAYVNRMDGGNTIFTAGGGKLKMRPQKIQIASTPKQNLTTFKSYTTTIHLRDDNDKPVPDTKLSLWADSHTAVYINGLYYVLGKKAIDISTDEAGNITIIEVTADMHAAVLSVSIPRDTEITIINPMGIAFYKLSELDNLKRLKDADYPANTVAGGVIGSVQRRKLVDPSIGDGNLDTVARSLGNLKEKLFFDNDGPLVVPAKGSDDAPEHFDFWMAAGDLFNWLKSGIKAVVNIVKDGVSEAWHFIAEIAGKVYKAVLNAVDAVIGAIEWVFEQIKTTIEEIIHFVEFLFDWDDIKRTKNVLHNVLKLTLKHQIDKIDAARIAFDEKVDEDAESLAKWGEITDLSSLGGVAEKPAVGSVADPSQSHKSGFLLFLNHFQSQLAKLEVKSVMPQQISTETAELIDILLNAISEEGEVLSGVYRELQTLASKFDKLSVGEVIKGLAAILAKSLLSSVRVVVDALFRVLASLADSAVNFLDAKIHIPIISDILNAIGIPDISFLDLLTCIAAVGYTVVYKAVNQKTPFPDNSDINAIIASKSWNELQGIITKKSVADDWESILENEPFGFLTPLQKLFNITGHAVTGFLIFSTNFVGVFEATAMTGDNPFSTVSAVAAFVIAGMQSKMEVGGLSIGITLIDFLSKIFFSGTVQDRLAVSSSGFAGLAVNDGRATSSVIDSIVVMPSLFKEAGFERPAAILDEVTNLTAYISTISYAVAVNDKDPVTKAIPIVVMAASNVVGSGLQVAASVLADWSCKETRNLMVAILLFNKAAQLQSIGPLKRGGGLESLHVVGVGVNVPDDSLCINQKSSGNRYSQGIIPIASLQINTEGVKDTLNGFRLVPNDAELTGKLVANIGQDLELELVLLSSRQRGVGKLRRDCDDGDTLCLEVIQVQLQRAQSQVAEGAPVTAVESD